MEEFEEIPELFARKILPLSYEDIIKGCMRKDSKIYQFCDKLWFWIQKLEYDLEETNMDKEKFFIDSCSEGRLAYVRILIEIYNIDPSYNNNYAITWASKRGHIEVVKLLLEDKRVVSGATTPSGILLLIIIRL